MCTKEWIKDLIYTKRNKLCLYFVGIDHRVVPGISSGPPSHCRVAGWVTTPMTVGIKFNSDDLAAFQSHITEKFYTKLKENIQNRFVSQDVVSCFSIFYPKRTRNSSENCTFGEDQVKVLFEHYGSELPAETVVGDEFLVPAIISSDLLTEWKIFRPYITNQPRENLNEQLRELSTNSMMQTMFPNFSILANVCLTIPVGTASVEHLFFQMRMMKYRLRNRLERANLSYLMKIALESPETKNCCMIIKSFSFMIFAPPLKPPEKISE